MEYGGADSITVEKWSLIKKNMRFQVIPYQNAGAAWNQSLMLNAIMVQASEVKILSMSSEVTYNCFFQEQMKPFIKRLSTRVLTDPMSSCFTMFHRVVPNAKAMVSVTWRILMRCTRSLMSKTFRPVTITCLLPNPEISHRRSCQNVRVWEQLSFLLIVLGRLQSSIQTTGQSTMCMAMTITFTKDGGSGNMYRTQERSWFRQW